MMKSLMNHRPLWILGFMGWCMIVNVLAVETEPFVVKRGVENTETEQIALDSKADTLVQAHQVVAKPSTSDSKSTTGSDKKIPQVITSAAQPGFLGQHATTTGPVAVSAARHYVPESYHPVSKLQSIYLAYDKQGNVVVCSIYEGCLNLIKAPPSVATQAPYLDAFEFTQGMDSAGGDIVFWDQGRGVDSMKKYCYDDPKCVGFNTMGWMKKELADQSKWNKWSTDPIQGLYVRKHK